MMYSGSGVSDKDQKHQRGNLALKNSIDIQRPVRVIHGVKDYQSSSSQGASSKVVTTYIYDGLYLVESYRREKSSVGHLVFMFQLRRILGQPELVIKGVKMSGISEACSALCMEDISQGKEGLPIHVVNKIDGKHPVPFKYTRNMIFPSLHSLNSPRGCDCVNGCLDSERCVCAVKNGGKIPFNHSGCIMKPKLLVYECGPSCSCPPSCHNRVSQHGIKFQLEIFKTELSGWGVRSLTPIPSGSFICEYAGELLEDEEAQKRPNDEYLFAIENNYHDESFCGGMSTSISGLQMGVSCKAVKDVDFAIDASEYGNVGRFINHSCSPNLYAQDLLYDHNNRSMPHIMLLACKDIPPYQELTYDYNYKIDQVYDTSGNIKKKKCYRSSVECTGWLY